MPGYFDQKNLDRLHAGLGEMNQQFGSLRDAFTSRPYRTERGREFAFHGFCRRLGTMARAIDIVFEKLPPELDAIPERDTVVDATMAIQAFVMNAFGCLDNLAWVWVCEKPVVSNGKDLDPMKVGLGPKYKEVRASFSAEFVKYLESRQDWVDRHLKGFRDSLAHRIPLYIPPYVVTPEMVDTYNRLERESGDALMKLDLARYDALQAEQKALGIWRPWMTHSATERAPQAGVPLAAPSGLRDDRRVWPRDARRNEAAGRLVSRLITANREGLRVRGERARISLRTVAS